MASNLDRRNAKIIRLRGQGMLLEDIAHEVGCSIAVVKYVVEVHFRTAAQERERVKKRIHFLRRKGFTIREIALEMDLGEYYVDQVLKHYNPSS